MEQEKLAGVDITETKMFVGGRWIDSIRGETFAAVSPVTGEKIAEIAKGDRADVDKAVQAARDARDKIGCMPPFERARLCHRIADVIQARKEELARIVALDQGKPYHLEALDEVDECVDYFRIAAEDIKRLETAVIPSASASKRVLTIRQPRGVYGIISPWNWPLTMPAEFIAPALAAGNAVVWSPSSSTSLVSVKLAECIVEAGLPEGVFNLVTGPGSVVGDEVAGHEGIDAIAFVGSTEVGRHVASKAAGKPMLLEMGGNGPIIVLEDADLEKAVEGIMSGCFLCAGQSCTAGERILVHRGIYDELSTRLVEATASIVLGDPLEQKTTMGPVNNEEVASRMDRHIGDAVSRGAKVLAGGHRAKGFSTSLFYEATVLAQVTTEMEVAREETFGPIAPLISVASDEQALEVANNSPYGLLSAVYTKDLSRAFRFAEKLLSGWVNINGSSNYWESHLPFGGRSGKSSGLGRVGGRYALLEMTDLKTIVIDIGE